MIVMMISYQQLINHSVEWERRKKKWNLLPTQLYDIDNLISKIDKSVSGMGEKEEKKNENDLTKEYRRPLK